MNCSLKCIWRTIWLKNDGKGVRIRLRMERLFRVKESMILSSVVAIPWQ